MYSYVTDALVKYYVEAKKIKLLKHLDPFFVTNFIYLVLLLASLSLVEADAAHWLIETELNKIGFGKRVQIW